MMRTRTGDMGRSGGTRATSVMRRMRTRRVGVSEGGMSHLSPIKVCDREEREGEWNTIFLLD